MIIQLAIWWLRVWSTLVFEIDTFCLLEQVLRNAHFGGLIELWTLVWTDEDYDGLMDIS